MINTEPKNIICQKCDRIIAQRIVGVEIIDNQNQIVSCVCGSQRFEVLPSHEFPNDFMAFCTQCERGKALELWQKYKNTAVGFITKSEWIQKGK
jgi:hypothetical protein